MVIHDVGSAYRMVIRGAPVTKKNHQQIAVNKKTGRPFIVQSAPLRRWAKKAKKQLEDQWSSVDGVKYGPIAQPVRLTAVFFRERNTGDFLNYLAAVSDALQDAGVLGNDVWIKDVDGSRLDKDAENPRVVVVLTVTGDPP